MRILAIRGKNLASLAAEFEVDFRMEPLAAAGLFAICGPTGSGKSTLLDALCVALYGDTPRLKNATGRGINLPDIAGETIAPHDPRTLLRRGAADGSAEVDFVANDGLEYRSRWSVRRSRGKASGKLQAVEMSLTKLADKQPIGNLKTEILAAIQDKLGLTFEQFTRAVLLAQNEFFAFLKADDNARAELLETLTGTDMYAQISMRVFSRWKTEGEALALLNNRMQDLQPLSAEERKTLDGETKEAGEAAKGIETENKLREKHLTWFTDLDALNEEERLALLAAEAALNNKKSAEPRRISFLRIEHVQNAKPLVVEFNRLISDVNVGKDSVTLAKTEDDAASAAFNEADTLVAATNQAVAAAEQSKKNAAVDLEKARNLDARIEALKPQREQSERDLKTALDAETKVKTESETAQKLLNAALEKQAGIEDWLKKNECSKALAESWHRWDTLFRQASEAQREVNKTLREWTAAQVEETSKATAAAEAFKALEKETAAIRGEETILEAAALALAVFNVEEMTAERKYSADRFASLTAAESVWLRLEEKQARMTALEQKAREERGAIDTAEEALRTALLKKPECETELKQTERMFEAAQLASAEGVETLRGTLEAGMPCPVCGSKEHPYVAEDPRVRNMLDELQRGVEKSRLVMAEVERIVTSSQTIIENSKKLVISFEQELRSLAQEKDKDDAAWLKSPIAVELTGIAQDRNIEWLAEQLNNVRTRIGALEHLEQAYRKATLEKNGAQTKVDNIRERHQLSQQAENAARSAAEHVIAATRTAADKKNSAVGRLDGLIAELGSTMTDAEWRSKWDVDPEKFHQRKKTEADLWSGNSREAEQLVAGMGKLLAELQGLNALHLKATEALKEQEGKHEKITEEFGRMVGERLALFEGKSVAEVETAFNKAIDEARKYQEKQNGAKQEALTLQAAKSEAHTQAKKSLNENEEQMQGAEKLLGEWISAYNAGGSDHETLTVELLRTLVSYDGPWIADERTTLQKLEDAVGQANAVLAGRKAKREKHQLACPTQDVREAVQAALYDCTEKLRLANERAMELIVKLRQDDERIETSKAIFAEMKTQEAKERVWAQLNELIGSSDGKKFRNYAQQFTLDVLLGYANRHLIDLSRRYRLERVMDTLAMLIVDQDMGDERRSVHSLSGGESFLVSLALALGLASLSSSRVRVESLFIDEGFGSLDAETLMVAMNALDNLQAMGRKVGVISHVQEMTERIGTQIQIQKMSGGQSRVEVVSI